MTTQAAQSAQSLDAWLKTPPAAPVPKSDSGRNLALAILLGSALLWGGLLARDRFSAQPRSAPQPYGATSAVTARSQGIGRSYASCVRPIGVFDRAIHEGGTRDAERIRQAEYVHGYGSPSRLEVAGDDPLAWATLTLPRARSARRKDVQYATSMAAGFLLRCAMETENDADSEWLESSALALLAKPGKRIRQMGPRTVTLSLDRGADHYVLRVAP
jgi:hypothetical protein